MKKLGIILFGCLSIAYSQNTFIGTIEYKLVEDDNSYVYAFHNGHVPTKIILHFRKGDVAQIFMDETSILSKYIFKHKQKDMIVISDSTYCQMPLDRKMNIELVPMNETVEILGHSCKKYHVRVSHPVYNLTVYSHYIWAARDIKVPSSDLLQTYGNDLFLNEIPVAFLKVENLFGLHYEATVIDSTVPGADVFKIPNGFKKTKTILHKLTHL